MGTLISFMSVWPKLGMRSVLVRKTASSSLLHLFFLLLCLHFFSLFSLLYNSSLYIACSSLSPLLHPLWLYTSPHTHTYRDMTRANIPRSTAFEVIHTHIHTRVHICTRHAHMHASVSTRTNGRARMRDSKHTRSLLARDNRQVTRAYVCVCVLNVTREYGYVRIKRLRRHGDVISV